MRTDGLRRLGWAMLSGILRAAGWLFKVLAFVPLELADAALRGAAAAHLNSLADPRVTMGGDR